VNSTIAPLLYKRASNSFIEGSIDLSALITELMDSKSPMNKHISDVTMCEIEAKPTAAEIEHEFDSMLDI